jgi:Uma2 family endonuclease
MAEASVRVQWTVADLASFPDDGQRYEVIEGELFVSKAASNDHGEAQSGCIEALGVWNRRTRLGHVLTTPGLIFGPLSGVIPDVVWVSRERRAIIEGEDKHLHGAPELVVEVLSPGPENERRDREAKLKLYSTYGVLEYWIVDWRLETVAVYRHHEGQLHLAATLTREDTLTSPVLPGFALPVANLFPR